MIKVNYDLLREMLSNENGVKLIADGAYDNKTMIYMFSCDETYNRNAYRVFVGENGGVCFQCMECAYMYNGEYAYDEPIDFWAGDSIGYSFAKSDVNTEMVFDTIMMLVRETTRKYGSVTVYEYTVDEYRQNVCENDCVVDENTKHIYVNFDIDCPYIGIETNNGEYYVYGAKFDSKVSCDEMYDKLLHYKN